MSDKLLAQSDAAFEEIERCHTLLADVFPHEGCLAIGGSRRFVGTAAFDLIVTLTGGLASRVARWGDLSALWSAAEDLAGRIRARGRSCAPEEVDRSVRLLYLANGIGWHVLSERLHVAPRHNPNYVRVEPCARLLALCGEPPTWAVAPGDLVIALLIIRLKGCIAP